MGGMIPVYQSLTSPTPPPTPSTHTIGTFRETLDQAISLVERVVALMNVLPGKAKRLDPTWLTRNSHVITLFPLF